MYVSILNKKCLLISAESQNGFFGGLPGRPSSQLHSARQGVYQGCGSRIRTSRKKPDPAVKKKSDPDPT